MDQERTRVKQTISQLQSRGDLFTRRLIHEKQRIASSQIKLKNVQSQIIHLRDTNKRIAISLLNKHTNTPNDAYHRVDGVNPTQLAMTNQNKIVKNYESRLSKALVRKNRLENENNEMKRKIDGLRRKVYGDIKSRERMEREMVEIRCDMDRIMERAAVASEERDERIRQRNEILAENHRRQDVFDKEYRDLSDFIARQSKAMEESIASAADNVVSMLSSAAGDGHYHYNGQTNTAATGKGTDSSEDRKQLEEMLASLDNEYNETQKILHENECKIQAFEEKFRELQHVSGLSSTDDIIATFVKNEEECFSIFNYIQTVNQDCDKTIEQANQLRADIDEYRRGEMEKERVRAETVNVYKGNLEHVKTEREKMYQTAIECRRTVEVIAKKITALYFKLRCNEMKREEHAMKDALPAKLRSDRKLTTINGGEVSEQNILNLMELIETRSIQIINTYLQSSSTSPRRLSRRPSLLLSPNTFERVVANRSGLENQINLNECTDESDEECESSSDDDEQENRPMSVHDMRRQAAQIIKRPESAMTSNSANQETNVAQKNLPRHTVF